MSIQYLSLLRYEWIITLIVLLLIIFKLNDLDQKSRTFMGIMQTLLLLNFLAGLLPLEQGTIFSGFFRTTALISWEKNILNLGLLLISLTSGKWVAAQANKVEFYILLLASMLGVFTMLSSGHILTLYLGLEMSTIPLAALANFNRSMKNSSEAGLKLILSSAFSTGIMLFGISLLYGATGNLGFDWIISHLQVNALTLLAFTFILAGFAFKMSIVPFHLWTADVYEGSPVPITNYLSVISKGSVIFVFISILYTVFGSMKEAWLFAVSLLSMLSMTIGNFFAMRQMNIKRLLAFSSITQVGFVLVAVAGASKAGMTAAVYFVLIYMLSNIAAFGVVGAIADSKGKEDLKYYKGLYKSNPFYALILALSLFSLAGIPPTAGFFGKLFLLTSGIGSRIYLLLAVAAINLVFSLYNYLRVIRIMFMDEAEEPMGVVEKNRTLSLALIICIAGILVIGFISPIYEFFDSISIF